MAVSRSKTIPAATESRGSVQPIHPIRVVLAGRDLRFLRVTSFLLERRGFEVVTTPRLGKLHEVVETFRPNVVALETDGALPTAVRTAAELSALHPTIGLVLVAEDKKQHSSGDFRVVEKWAPIERLAEELELAYIGIPQRLPQNHTRPEPA